MKVFILAGQSNIQGHASLRTIFNGAGLPASLFRTDDWPVSDAEKK